MITIDFPATTVHRVSEIVYFTLPKNVLSELDWIENNGEILIVINCDDGVVVVKKYTKTSGNSSVEQEALKQSEKEQNGRKRSH